jgi:hypothetical protein
VRPGGCDGGLPSAAVRMRHDIDPFDWDEILNRPFEFEADR